MKFSTHFFNPLSPLYFFSYKSVCSRKFHNAVGYHSHTSKQLINPFSSFFYTTFMIVPSIYSFSNTSLFDLPLMKVIPYSWLSSSSSFCFLSYDSIQGRGVRMLEHQKGSQSRKTNNKFVAQQNQISLATNYPKYLKTHFKSSNGLKASTVYTARLSPPVIYAYYNVYTS